MSAGDRSERALCVPAWRIHPHPDLRPAQRVVEEARGCSALATELNTKCGTCASTTAVRMARPAQRPVHRWRPVPEWFARSFVAAIVRAEQAMRVNLECVSVPAAGFGRRRVGAVQKPRKRLIGVACGSYRLIGQQELLVLIAVVSSIGFYAVFREALRFGIRVRIERALFAPAWPEAAAAQLARIALDHHPVGAVWCSACVRRCGPTRKSRASQIQGSPEEMDWTDLAGKRCAEVEDDPVCLHQLLPEHVCCIGIEFGVLKVFGERNRRIDLIWMRDDLRRNAQTVQRREGFTVELGHWSGGQRHRTLASVTETD